MTATEVIPDQDEVGAALAAARTGDQAAFGAIVERHRGELQVHCYRMLGSLDEAEDLVQETFLRAWRKRSTFAGRASFRAWLYRIATNACLDALERRKHRPEPLRESRTSGDAPPSAGSYEVPWLQPYPDRLLEQAAPAEAEPDASIVGKETIELAFIVAIQHLPATQRAVLLARGVLGWSAKETAEVLETSVAAVNSALQRARATLRERLPERRLEWAPGSDPTEAEQALLRRYVEVTEDPDPDAFAELMREDVRFAMPPEPETWVGVGPVIESWKAGGFGSQDFGTMRCVVTRTNRQPAVACYVRRPGDDRYRPMALDVLRIEAGLVAEITTFPLADLIEPLDLPAELPASPPD